MTSPTLTVGGGTVGLLQTSASLTSVNTSSTGPNTQTLTLPVASTAGTALVAIFTNPSVTPVTVSTAPAGFTRQAATSGGAGCDVEVWIYANNPGNIQAITFIWATPNGSTNNGYLLEVSNLGRDSITQVDLSATGAATGGTTLSLAASGNPVGNGELALAIWIQVATAVAAGTFTSPIGYTRLVDDGATVSNTHTDMEYQLGPSSGAVTLTSSLTTAGSPGARGVLLILKPAQPLTAETDFITYGSIQAKLNTLDLGLMLGGRHLLESAGPGDNSGHLLEDGSGVRLLDTYLPQLGDPVTMTNPSWSGRVTSVNSEDVFQDGKRTNYNRAAIEATNSTAAPGGTAPGDFADTAVGGHHQLEDGSGARLLEDGTYYHLLEGTAFVYRNLSLRKSQNQDGATTTYGYLETFETGYAAGMTFTLTSVNLGIAAVSYTITNVTTSLIGAGSSPTPVYGIEFGDAYQTLQTAGGGVLTRTGSQATQQLGVAMPAGSLGYAQVTATQTPITVQTDATGLTVTVTVVSGRRVNLKAFVKMSSTTASDILRVYLMEGATQLTYDETVPNSTTATPAITPEVILQPSAGVHTYKVQVQRFGAGTVTLQADATFPAYIMAEDAGT